MTQEGFKHKSIFILSADTAGYSPLMEGDGHVKWDEIQRLTPLRTKLCVPPPRSNWITRPRP